MKYKKLGEEYKELEEEYNELEKEYKELEEVAWLIEKHGIEHISRFLIKTLCSDKR